jgi:hypothetical protein
MYSKKDGLEKRLVVDRREHLRVKVKSLMAEAAIIRAEEKRTWGQLRDELAVHRRTVVRNAARSAHIALSLIKGRKYSAIEATYYKIADWDEVKRLLKKYGPSGCESLIPNSLPLPMKPKVRGRKERPARRALPQATAAALDSLV